MITSAAPEFAAHFPNGGRLIGLDVGTKTIGVAFCDANWSFATPGKTIIRKKFSVDLETLKALIAEHNIVGLVVGLPLNMDGSDSPRTQRTRAFARNLAPPGLPLLLWDRSEERRVGKECAVRVDLGGRRIIKKKKKK